MKIAGAVIAMQSQHVAAAHSEAKATWRAWAGQERPDFEGARQRAPSPPPPAVQISDAGKATQSTEANAIEQASDAADHDPVLMLIKAMLAWLTGKPVKLFDPGELRTDAPALPQLTSAHAAPQAQPSRRAGYGVEYDYHAVREESEQTDFSAQGIVKTADGRAIAFKLDLAMSRHYREETNFSLRAGDAVRKDPLVINFGGAAAQLTSQHFRFDIDGDGKTEDLPQLAGGSGYLALDLNRNGKIDSGAELFGPASGSGFAELAAHDRDGNGWIDENDPVFAQIRIWTPDAKGAGSLFSLQERNVGALSLARVDTAFELRGPDHQDLGAVRSTGIYLTESGQAGSVQEIDLTV